MPKIEMRLDMTEYEEIDVWKEYVRTKDPAIREFFVKKYAPLVKYVAGKVAVNMPDSIEFDDLVGFGFFGLLDAIEKFDPYKNIKFKTYAVTRIRGQIYDDLRSLDWVPRSVRQKNKEIEEAVKNFEKKHGRAPTDKEIAKVTGFEIQQIQKMSNLTSDTAIASLDDIWYFGDDNDQISVLDTVEAPESIHPNVQVERQEVRKTIYEAIKKLPENEQNVLVLYYYEDLTLKEIGAVLEVTESRVSQLHTRAILRLRNLLNEIKKSLI
ncbi:MAG: RNA polymerase sigma factor WhiG [Spirochaetes bacterium GWF1_41_5]|nr:MAG: RNA polymerase sigma factor WhiG [Spirochaetes bacterium GWF1_41_5]HBE03039.1 RNA polymerase sigma factor WhiG [Spirochaetia bacterium]